MPPLRLVLLRHAKAEQLGTEGALRAGAQTDHARPLTPRGRRDAAAVGGWLVAQGLVPDLVLCSTAARTRQTLEQLALDTLAPEPGAAVEHHDALYEAAVDTVLALVATTAVSVRTVLVVGHEPTTSAVAARLAGPGSDEAALAVVRLGLPTAGLAVVDLDAWSATRGVLRQVASVHA